MNVITLIDKLQALANINGDLEIRVADSDLETTLEITDVDAPASIFRVAVGGVLQAHIACIGVGRRIPLGDD